MNIILSPHFDDAVLSLGGLLAQHGRESVVGTFFGGVPTEPLVCPWDRKCGFTDSTDAMRARAEENKHSLRSFNVSAEHIRNYEHLDAQYRQPGNGREFSRAKMIRALAHDISDLLDEFESAQCTVYAPGIEGHADHALLKAATLLVRHRRGRHRLALCLYQDIPYLFTVLEQERTRGAWRRLIRRDPRCWKYAFVERVVTGHALRASVHAIPLTSLDLDKKLAGIRYYVSQLPSLGRRLFHTIKRSAAAQARSLSLDTPYCEVTYEVEE